MTTLSVVNSVALGKENIYVQSRFQNGIDVFDYSGCWIKKIDVDSYFGWTLKLYKNQLFYGASDNSIKIFDLKDNKHISTINPEWKVINQTSNFDGRYTFPTGFAIYKNEIYVVDSIDNSIICLSLDGKLKYRKSITDITSIDTRIVRLDVSEKFIIASCVEANAIILMDRSFKIINTIIKTGSRNGEFEVPWDVKLAKNRIYISDLYNHRIQVFDYNLNYLNSYGTWGTNLGEFNYVYSMDIGDKYAVFADTWNHGFQIWKKNSSDYVAKLAIKKPNHMQLLRPNRVTIINDMVVVSDYLNHSFKFFNKSLTECNRIIGKLGFNVGEFRYPSGITKYLDSYYCIDTRSGRVTEIKGNNEAKIFLKGHYSAPMSPDSTGFLKSFDNDDLILKLASDITHDTQGNIYIADMGNKAIIKISRSGDFICSIGKDIIDVKNKTSFIGCKIYKDQLYVTNPAHNEVLIFSLEGKLLHKLTGYELNTPTGIDVNNSLIAIADRLNNRIIMIDKASFKIKKVIGKLGNSKLEFCAPWDVALDNKTLYVADSLNNRLQKIDIKELYE